MCVVSGRTAECRGGVGQDCSPTELFASGKHGRHVAWTLSQTTRTSKIHFETMKEQNALIITGSLPFYHPFITRTKCWLLTSGSLSFVSVNPSHAKNIRESAESKNRPYHGRVVSGRTAGWRSRDRQGWVPTEMCASRTILPRTLHSIVDRSLEGPPQSTNKRKPL